MLFWSVGSVRLCKICQSEFWYWLSGQEFCVFIENGGYVEAGCARLWQPLFFLSFAAGKVKTAGETVQEVACWDIKGNFSAPLNAIILQIYILHRFLIFLFVWKQGWPGKSMVVIGLGATKTQYAPLSTSSTWSFFPFTISFMFIVLMTYASGVCCLIMKV